MMGIHNMHFLKINEIFLKLVNHSPSYEYNQKSVFFQETVNISSGGLSLEIIDQVHAGTARLS